MVGDWFNWVSEKIQLPSITGNDMIELKLGTSRASWFYFGGTWFIWRQQTCEWCYHNQKQWGPFEQEIHGPLSKKLLGLETDPLLRIRRQHAGQKNEKLFFFSPPPSYRHDLTLNNEFCYMDLLPWLLSNIWIKIKGLVHIISTYSLFVK